MVLIYPYALCMIIKLWNHSMHNSFMIIDLLMCNYYHIEQNAPHSALKILKTTHNK